MIDLFFRKFLSSRCYIWYLSILIINICCSPNIIKYSARNPDLFQKPSDKLYGQSRGIDPAQTQPEIFIKEKKAVVRDLETPNTTGSLFQSDNEYNFLFTPASVGKVGRFIAIQVKANQRIANEEAPEKSKEVDPTKKNSEEKPTDEEDILKAIPNLEPKEKNKISLLKEFKMRIMHKFPNGDILAKFQRQSSSDVDFHQLVVESRIPYDRLASGEALTTDDLLDVKFTEHLPDEIIKRHSSGWEDEYSLRLSGFNEAKSKIAADLADQRQKLDEAKTRLQDRIKSLGSERRQLAKMREEYAQRKLESENKLKESNDKLDESQQTIEEQKETIEEQQQKLEDIEGKKAAAEAKKGSKDE